MPNFKKLFSVFKQRWILIFVSLLLSFSVKDAIAVFTDAFLQYGALKLEYQMPEDTGGYYAMIVNEGTDGDIFQDLLEAFKSQEVDSGWTYTPGESGVSWTNLSSSTPGAEIKADRIIMNSGFYFTVMKSKWNSSLYYSVNGGKPIKVECYDPNSNGELLRVYPFQQLHYITVAQVLLHLLAALSFYVLLIGIKSWYTEGDPVKNEKDEKNEKII